MGTPARPTRRPCALWRRTLVVAAVALQPGAVVQAVTRRTTTTAVTTSAPSRSIPGVPVLVGAEPATRSPTTTRPGPTTTTTRPGPTTTTIPAVATTNGILLRRVAYARGALVFDPPGTRRPRYRKADALYLANKASKSVAHVGRPNVYFGLFSSETGPERVDASGERSAAFDHRAVWVVRYRGVERERARPIVIGSRTSAATTTTTTPDTVRVDVVYVFDDDTGDQVLRSEYAAEPD